MKEENGNQDVGATAFDLRNNEAPKNYNNIYHTNKRVPHPTNHAAKVCPGNEAMDKCLGE